MKANTTKKQTKKVTTKKASKKVTTKKAVTKKAVKKIKRTAILYVRVSEVNFKFAKADFAAKKDVYGSLAGYIDALVTSHRARVQAPKKKKVAAKS